MRERTMGFEHIDRIVAALRQAGYEPFSQLRGYLITGNAAYITRRGNARELIRSVDLWQLQMYLQQMAAPSTSETPRPVKVPPANFRK